MTLKSVSRQIFNLVPLNSYNFGGLMNSYCLRFVFTIFSVVCSMFFSLFVMADDLSSGNNLNSSNHLKKDHHEAKKSFVLPPLPEGVSELSFNEFFKMPIGPRGLEPTEKLLSLNNKHVRVIGYMAQEDDPTPGIFMLAARPVNVGEKADGMADDLPAATLYVHMPFRDADKVLTYRPAPWVLTGVLQVGNQEESNSRISFVRLIMEQHDIDSAKKIKNKKEKTIKQGK